MKFTIITATYNSEKTIKDLLISIGLQTYKNIEHIIIDNSSSDSTLFLVKKYGIKNTIIKSKKDKGTFFAMNEGIRLSSGNFILFLNSDDWLLDKNTLNRIYEAVKNDTKIIFNDILIVSSKFYPYKVIRKWDNSSIDFSTGSHTPHPGFFASKELFLRYGFFDTRFKIAADYDLMYRFVKSVSNSQIIYTKTISSVMRSGGLSSSSPLAILKSNLEILIFNTLKQGTVSSILTIVRKIIAKFKQYDHDSENLNVAPPSINLNFVDTEILISIVYYDTALDVFLQTINSVIKSLNINFYLVIINNSDANICFIEKLHKHIYVVNHGKNIGFGAGHNITLNSGAISKFFLALNPDIEFQEDFLRKFMDKYETLENPGFLTSQLYFKNKKPQQSFRQFPTFISFFINLFRNIEVMHKLGDYEVSCISGCFLFAKTDRFISCNGFDERFFLYMEDVDLAYRMSINFKNYFSSDFAITHSLQRGSRKSLKLFFLHFISFLKFYSKKASLRL